LEHDAREVVNEAAVKACIKGTMAELVKEALPMLGQRREGGWWRSLSRRRW
jgi:hypothetical protein